MGLIKKSAELTIPQTVKMMIYGQAGMGKTTLALSTPKPLLLDFDNGVKRVNMSHLDGVDIVQVTSWKDVQEVLQEDLSSYQTIVIDTIGKLSGMFKVSREMIYDARNIARNRRYAKNTDIPRILLFDIETAPMMAFVWKLWKENVSLLLS